jgi:hypothetical protein
MWYFNFAVHELQFDLASDVGLDYATGQ